MINSPHKHHDDVFGQELVLNLVDCDPKKISSKKEIQKFVVELCDKVIHMKRYGKAIIPHFGHDNPITAGYSLVQLIETSSVTAHFSELKKSVYLNIFSCQWFDHEKTVAYCKHFFEAKRVEINLLIRT